MKILISITNQHWIHKTVVHKAIALLADKRYKTHLIMPSHRPYVNNLHHILKDFKEGDDTFWLNIDSDNPPIRNPLDLVVLDKDLIGLPTPIWHFTDKKTGDRPIYWNGYDYKSDKDAYIEHEPKRGLQRVDAIGTGCFLAHRRIFTKLRAPFMRKWSRDGAVHKGNDISFCERVRSKGY